MIYETIYQFTLDDQATLSILNPYATKLEIMILSNFFTIK